MIVNIPFFNTEIEVITSKKMLKEFLAEVGNRDKIKDFLEERWEASGGCTIRIDIDGDTWFIVFIQQRWSLNHEATHIAEFLCEKAGIKYLAKVNDELRAYMNDYIYRIIKEAI